MKTQVTPFLMFEGKAEEAMNLYVSLFPDSRVSSISRYGPGEAGKEGTVRQAVFALAGQSLMCIDIPVKHELAQKLFKIMADVMAALGVFANVRGTIGFETASKVAYKYGYETENIASGQ